MSVLYEVNTVVSTSVYPSWLNWIRDHMTEMCKIDGFLGAKLYFRDAIPEEGEDSERFKYAVCVYQVRDREAMKHYLDVEVRIFFFCFKQLNSQIILTLFHLFKLCE